jgi:copper(I)-binding protein
MAKVGDISLRQIHLAYPNGGQYKAGDDAELTMAIINGGSEDDSLVDITGDSFSDVRITGGTAAGSTGSTSSGSGGSGSSGTTIPAHSALYLGQEGPTVALTNLSESLTPAQSIEITLTFEKAGEVTVQASVASPSRSLPRGESFDFSKESSGSSAG